MFQQIMVQRMESSICIVIFMRTSSPFVKGALLGLDRFVLLFPCCQRVALCSMPRVSASLLLTLQLFPSVSWRWKCAFVPHTALLVSLEFPTVFLASEGGVVFLPFVKKNILNLPLLACNSYFGIFKTPTLHCFLLNTSRHDKPHYCPDRFWSPCILFLVKI